MPRSALLAVIGIPATLCAVWTVLAGKDVNWDLLNYHYYVAYELLGGRLGQDFYAASAQSYLNPIGYVPFYLLASTWHSLFASLALAVAASASLAFLFLLAWRLFAHQPSRERVVFAILGTSLGAATAVFWPMVGTSMLDPWLAALMLGGVLLLVDPDALGARRALIAGALFGAAAALKYSNAVFALAALVLVFGRSARVLLAYTAGASLAVAVLAGPWCVALFREFGNPVFPLFNAWFRSPYAPPVNLVSERFSPHGIVDALTLPLRMMTVGRSVYIETPAPDVRVAALIAAALALPLLRSASASPRALRLEDRRTFAFLAFAGVLWVLTSSNGRYGVVVLLLAGLCLARLVERMLPGGMARVLLGSLLAVQLALCFSAAAPRWFVADSWSRHWLPYQAPARAVREPALYISVEILPMAVVAPFLHTGSSFVNLRGQHSIPSDSTKLAALVERYRGHLRTLGRDLGPDVIAQPRQLATYDLQLQRLGLRVDPRDCFTIAWRPDDEDAVSRLANRISFKSSDGEPLSVASCALVRAPRDPALEAAERRASALFDRIEKACPALFHGQTAATDPIEAGWGRLYPGLDARLELRGEHLVLNRYYAGTAVDLGKVADWGSGAGDAGDACAAHIRQP